MSDDPRFHADNFGIQIERTRDTFGKPFAVTCWKADTPIKRTMTLAEARELWLWLGDAVAHLDRGEQIRNALAVMQKAHGADVSD